MRFCMGRQEPHTKLVWGRHFRGLERAEIDAMGAEGTPGVGTDPRRPISRPVCDWEVKNSARSAPEIRGETERASNFWSLLLEPEIAGSYGSAIPYRVTRVPLARHPSPLLAARSPFRFAPEFRDRISRGSSPPNRKRGG